MRLVLEMGIKKKLKLYLRARSEFHRIPAYSDSDRSSVHIQEHSRHRSCKDCFHMKTENNARKN